MKKVLSILAVAATMTATVSAQTSLGSLLGGLTSGSSTSSTLGNIVSGLAGTVYSAPVSLNGTYTYGGSAVSVSSSEGNVLTNLAGTAASSAVESKVDEQLAKFGITPGAMTFTFNNEDNTFTMDALGVSIPGTYKVGDGEKTVTLTFGKTLKYLSMTGNLESTTNGAKMVFQANKMVSLLKKVLAVAGQSSSGIAAISSLADGYDNYKVGFKLTK
ncbi:MAG: DUF4923 family protein [Bacteroidales bacterium]|nr:DUF4923 family protein [Bacteroidales bacterium]